MYGLSTQKSGRCREVDTVNQIHCKGGLYPGGGGLIIRCIFSCTVRWAYNWGEGEGLKGGSLPYKDLLEWVLDSDHSILGVS